MKPKLFFLVTILTVLCYSGIAYAGEEITLTTYYPAPYGEYEGLAVGDPNNGYTAPADPIDLIVEGNVGIGTTGPAAKLDVNGNIRANKHITHLTWQNFAEPACEPDGWIKLSTPIVHNEGNMFIIRIFGYQYSGDTDAGDVIDIQCTGYAYAGSTLINTRCHTEGTDIPVEMGTETRADQGGNRVVVIRLGSPSWDWYYPHLTAEYVGWKAKDPDDFKWVSCEATPASSTNRNQVVIRDDTGDSYFNAGNVGIGTTGPLGKLDIMKETRTGTSPTHAPALYVTMTNSADSGGVEFRHSNQTQGIGFGYNTIYATGSNTNQHLNLMPRGTGNIGIGTTSPTAKLHVGGTAGVDGIRFPDGTLQTTAATAAGGSVFIRWGNDTAPAGTTFLYSGYGFNEHYTQAGGVEAICMKSGDPGAGWGSNYGDLLYPLGTGDSTRMPPGITAMREIKCAVCYAPAPTFTIWGTWTCPDGWTPAYTGYGMGGYYAHHQSCRHCVDNVNFDASVVNTTWGDIWYGTVLYQNIDVGIYTTLRYVKCAVCIKE